MSPRAFVELMMRGVDPFAIREAERELRRAGIGLDRSVLVRQYLVGGQVDSLVQALVAAGPDTNRDDVCAHELASCEFERAENPRLVNPLGWTLVYSVMFLVATSIVAVPLAIGLRAFVGPALWWAVAGLVVFVICVAAAYACAGAKWGRRRAREILTALLGMVLIALVYLLVHRRL